MRLIPVLALKYRNVEELFLPHLFFPDLRNLYGWVVKKNRLTTCNANPDKSIKAIYRIYTEFFV
ncbi:hypothetical protein EGY05_19055 [Chryseobacterium arthrosphaerae]|nr:hypothetical protein EGY05_19055 [Chryseobacterium arthrosphaerae]